MIGTYSYRRIIAAIIWRGVLLGAGLGALFGTMIFPVIGTVVGAGLGGFVGLLMGTIDGLFVSCITWLCRPFYMTDKFTRFTSSGAALLTFIGAELIFGTFFSFQFTSPIIIAAAAIAGLASSWVTHRVAENISVGDLFEKVKHKRKNDERPAPLDAPEEEVPHYIIELTFTQI